MKPTPRPGAARAEADAESGNEGAAADSRERQLFALDAMHKRGLIPEAEYQRRRAEISDSQADDA